MSVDLAYVETGPQTDLPPLLVLHGLYGAGRNWSTMARRLAERRRVVTVDLRNHGDSPWADGMDYRSMAEDVGALIDRLGYGPAAVMGHSMGGKAAMMLALTAGRLVERLVVVDIAPVAYSQPGVLVYAETLKRLDLSALARRGEAERALAADVPDRTVRAFLAQNLVTGPDGKLRWRLNLDAIDTGMADLIDWPTLPAGTRYDGPVLLIDGGASGYVRPRDMATFRSLFPHLGHVTVPEAGHWVHFEKPEAFLAAVRGFLEPG
ncbi:MAG: alpha/beta fold hydrolase [Alphaproteobacteria bacterium]